LPISKTEKIIRYQVNSGLAFFLIRSPVAGETDTHKPASATAEPHPTSTPDSGNLSPGSGR
jgi:hypothetical protein